MYLMPILVPIYTDGEVRLVASDWKRALFLLRDSLDGRYGDLMVAAPWLTTDAPEAREQTLDTIAADEGIRLEPTVDAELGVPMFWLEMRRYHTLLDRWFPQVRVVHAGLDDPFRPLVELPMAMAFRRAVPVVFVQDTDVVVQMHELAGDELKKRARATVFSNLIERSVRAAAARADLSLLKGKALMNRYARFARNPREFHDTSFLSHEAAPEALVRQRLATIGEPRPLRLVYCGRLVARKGVATSVRLIELARRQGANVTFEIIGNGPEEPALRRQIENAGLGGAVRLAGAMPYGSTLLRHLAEYDALLFTPTAEDTPRMIFDGYAAGLPLVGCAIPYVEERAMEEQATVVLPRKPDEAAAAELVALDRDRQRLVALTEAALRAGKYHAADRWYQRRAEWTHEAVARRHARAA